MIPLQTQSMSDWDFLVIYDCSGEDDSDCDNVFSPENLKTIKGHVEAIWNMQEFKEICKATSVDSNECNPGALLSIIDTLEAYGLNIDTATQE